METSSISGALWEGDKAVLPDGTFWTEWTERFNQSSSCWPYSSLPAKGAHQSLGWNGFLSFSSILTFLARQQSEETSWMVRIDSWMVKPLRSTGEALLGSTCHNIRCWGSWVFPELYGDVWMRPAWPCSLVSMLEFHKEHSLYPHLHQSCASARVRLQSWGFSTPLQRWHYCNKLVLCLMIDMTYCAIPEILNLAIKSQLTAQRKQQHKGLFLVNDPEQWTICLNGHISFLTPLPGFTKGQQTWAFLSFVQCRGCEAPVPCLCNGISGTSLSGPQVTHLWIPDVNTDPCTGLLHPLITWGLVPQ